MFIFPPSGLGCDLEFGFGSFESIVRPLSRCRIVAGEVNRDGKRAARPAAPAYTRSVHVHRAVEPSSPASHAPRRTHVSTANQVVCVQFDVAAARRQQCAARRSPPHFFSGVLSISLFIFAFTLVFFIFCVFFYTHLAFFTSIFLYYFIFYFLGISLTICTFNHFPLAFSSSLQALHIVLSHFFFLYSF